MKNPSDKQLKAHHKQVQCGLLKDAQILEALPATRKQIREITGFLRSTLASRLADLIRGGVVVPAYQIGRENVYDVAPSVKVERTKPAIQAPQTRYCTRWIGGHHPCKTELPWARAL